MCRKRFLGIFPFLLCILLLAGCAFLPRNIDVPAAGAISVIEDNAIEYVEDVTMPVEIDYGYLSAEWSDEPYKRNGCTAYPLVLDMPLQQCRGFTVDYEISDVDGRMKADSKFQIFYRTGDGTWVKGEQFYLDDWYASVEQTISKPVTVTEVVVLCLNAGNFSWSVSMGIRAPLY